MKTMGLTAKQEKFAQGIASGLGQADAYRAAYDASKMKDNGIYREASLLIDNPKVAQRIAELKKTVEKKQLWTREMSIKALMTAFHEGNGTTKVAAVRELNAMHGFDKPEGQSSGVPIIQIVMPDGNPPD